jgi:hypothetical protein
MHLTAHRNPFGQIGNTTKSAVSFTLARPDLLEGMHQNKAIVAGFERPGILAGLSARLATIAHSMFLS